MTKPAITKRATKGSALTYTELDTNFQNLADATITVSDGTNSKALNLNDTLQFTAAGTVTIGVNSSTGVVTITGTGSGTVNSGASGALAYYPSAGSTVDDTGITYSTGSGFNSLDAGANTLDLAGAGVRLDAGGSAGNPVAVYVLYGGINTTGTSNFEVTAGQPHLITGGNFQSYSPGDTVLFGNFSGLLLTQNVTNRNVSMWLCGGASATLIGNSLSNTSGSVTYNLSNAGYLWTNNTGGTIQASFACIKTGPTG